MADKVTETWRLSPLQQESQRIGYLVQIYPTGPGLGTGYNLNDKPVVIGRDDDCDVCVDEQSVSRRHACIRLIETGFVVEDLNSTNGTFVNDAPAVAFHKLRDGDYLRVGVCIFRFLAGDNVEAHYHEIVYRMTIIDGLTNVHNKRYLLEFLEREIARSSRHHRPLSVVLMDIDHFKSINDTLGHLAGDAILRQLAGRLRNHVRQEDLLARFGGEEFALVLVETGLASAVLHAERCRQLVSSQAFHFEDKQPVITISLGVVAMTGDVPITPEELLRQADEKLYQAKAQGRNRVSS